MTIPFTKAHGARNDFLLSWADEVPAGDDAANAIAICHRHTGVGADGWLIVSKDAPEGCHGSIRLINSDGSPSEISGNGTRCAAAFLVNAGLAGEEVRIATGAGIKHLRLLRREGLLFEFFMNMGAPEVKQDEIRYELEAAGRRWDVTLLNVGNPQCAVFIDEFPADWRDVGRQIEHHLLFPRRTNVSFVRRVDTHTIDVRFWERGAGETMSSGTGSTGAAAAAMLRGVAETPVTVVTPAGPLEISWDDSEIHMTGPAEIVAAGQFHLSPSMK